MEENVMNEVVETVTDTAIETVAPVEVVDVVQPTSSKEVILVGLGAAGLAAGIGLYKVGKKVVKKYVLPKIAEAKLKKLQKEAQTNPEDNSTVEDGEYYVVDEDEE